jgi:hypothetical protein
MKGCIFICLHYSCARSAFCLCTYTADMLFLWLFIASNPKNLFGIPHWCSEWLGTVDRRYPAWCLDLRIPHLPFLWQPPPPPQ